VAKLSGITGATLAPIPVVPIQTMKLPAFLWIPNLDFRLWTLDFARTLPVLLAIPLVSGCGRSDPSTGADPQLSTDNPQAPTPWTNSLSMVFVPVPRTKVQFCIWETRVQDFAAFVNATGYTATQAVYSLAEGGWVHAGHTWKNPGFEQGPTHPVAGVSWNDAKAFCAWLTEREHQEGLIRTNQAYRLPTDSEWSTAIGLTKEDGKTPEEKQSIVSSSVWARAYHPGSGMGFAEIYAECAYPWGPKWPPPKDFGNYSQDFGADAYPFTAPVGAFQSNEVGLFDLSGNVWEWCEDLYNDTRSRRVFRGGPFTRCVPQALASWARGFGEPNERFVDRGFRVVLSRVQ